MREGGGVGKGATKATRAGNAVTTDKILADDEAEIVRLQIYPVARGPIQQGGDLYRGRSLCQKGPGEEFRGHTGVYQSPEQENVGAADVGFRGKKNLGGIAFVAG